MTAALCGPDGIVTSLGVSDHLAECPDTHLTFPLCSWCRWALSTSEIESLVALRRDIGALSNAPTEGTVAWVVAASEAERLFVETDVGAVIVPSARSLAVRLRDEVAEQLAGLRRRIGSMAAPGGPVESRCLAGSGPIAAVAVQHRRYRATLARLPADVARRLTALSARLSAEIQFAGLLPILDDLHPIDVPPLATQPEWERLRPADQAAARRRRRAPANGPAEGSLEAFVVEALIDGVTSDLIEMGADLGTAAPPVRVTRPVGDETLSSRSRLTLWRVADIDWNLTFVDSGQASCWDARVEGEVIVTDVPWFVALAVDAAASMGRTSATHQGRPTGRRGDGPPAIASSRGPRTGVTRTSRL